MCNILKNVIILNYLSYIFNTHVIYSLLLFLFYNQRRSHDIDPYYLLIFRVMLFVANNNFTNNSRSVLHRWIFFITNVAPRK
jgi:hypothetical protein